MAFFVNTAFDVWTDFEKGTSASFLNELLRKQLSFLIVSYCYYRAQKRILCLKGIAIEIKKNAKFDK
jgi:hypothetical protein